MDAAHHSYRGHYILVGFWKTHIGRLSFSDTQPFSTSAPSAARSTSDVLRQRARCTTCGSKGATLQHPCWGGNSIGFMPFPVDDV
jgi:hypothetical protein